MNKDKILVNLFLFYKICSFNLFCPVDPSPVAPQSNLFAPATQRTGSEAGSSTSADKSTDELFLVRVRVSESHCF